MEPITKYDILRKSSWIFILLLATSCIKPIDLQSFAPERFIVIEGNLTNELKKHEVIVTSTTSLRFGAYPHVGGAIVWVEDQSGERFHYEEVSTGIYTAITPYQPLPGNAYTLHVSLENGTSYSSETEIMPVETVIDSIYGRYVTIPSTTDENTFNGVQILVDSRNADDSHGWFRYEWEDTHVVNAPLLSGLIFNRSSYSVERRPPDEIIDPCYKSEKSGSLILETTQGLAIPRATEIPIKFLNEDSTYLMQRYSIKVRQFSLSSATYRFYKTLRENNEGSGTFFDSQKGTIIGNIHNDDPNGEVALGYFEVASIDEKRVFFSPVDFADQGFFQTGYPYCDDEEIRTRTGVPADDNFVLLDTVWLPSTNPYAPGLILNYVYGPVLCADCRELGPTDKPDFWIDE